jgi:hypothetical protein
MFPVWQFGWVDEFFAHESQTRASASALTNEGKGAR